MPEPPPVPLPAGAGFSERMVREDLTKEVVADLVVSQPDILVLDLIDERFDVVQVRDSWYTMSDYYERLGLVAAVRAAATATSDYRTPQRLPAVRRSSLPTWAGARFGAAADPHRASPGVVHRAQR